MHKTSFSKRCYTYIHGKQINIIIIINFTIIKQKVYSKYLMVRELEVLSAHTNFSSNDQQFYGYIDIASQFNYYLRPRTLAISL